MNRSYCFGNQTVNAANVIVDIVIKSLSRQIERQTTKQTNTDEV